MVKCVSFPLNKESLAEYGSWDNVSRDVHLLGCDGLEGIWAGEEITSPADLIAGYHLTFFTDWLDLYREDRAALEKKYGNMDNVRLFYGGTTRDTLLSLYREDLERAAALNPLYVVFHVSDISVIEGYTYRWLHSHEEVIDASAEVINTLLDGRDWPFEFLMENQWWPGFTLTDPHQTARLLDAVHYDRKGILLDTGHLMNTNTKLRTQAEGAAYIQDILDRHGSMAEMVHGMHLHQSLSGDYVKTHTGFMPAAFPENPVEQYSVSYGHILKIDQHQPWSDPAILPVLERIAPRYLTHELAVRNRGQRTKAVSKQNRLLSKLF